MDNLDKGYLLAKLFPEELNNIVKAIKAKCEYYYSNETEIRAQWNEKGFCTADYWYSLILHAQNAIDENQGTIWKRPKRFADQLFDSYRSIFPIACLIEYAQIEQCDYYLKLAIHLLFGDKQIAISQSSFTLLDADKEQGKDANTEYLANKIIGEMILRFEKLHLLNTSKNDYQNLQEVRKILEEILKENGYRMNYDKTTKEIIVKR